ncbi:MAG: 4-hydroxy-3-methylbut-2-enyl diphosphate reductase [Chloracidobacterium sp.]|nr:4-hydroxy-3-methylbut-2-enyl diphosphate reductase [Chloracidobacterium sp.]MDW8216498.1 4-hydroxy-3-methylbut-2-enyl diphosphate reductase [Acidobacteriota bacterium]
MASQVAVTPSEIVPARARLPVQAATRAAVARDFGSPIIEAIRRQGYWYRVGRLTFRLAREFGFCYGVDDALDLAYEARRRFNHQTIYLTGEIIHNPVVNNRLTALGVRPLDDLAQVTPRDVVIIPAFGLPVSDLARLRETGCTVIDTTCGSVVHVWKRVERYARDGFTTIIHGKHDHEETTATRSHILAVPGGRYVVVRNLEEAELVAEVIAGTQPAATLQNFFVRAASPGFDPARDLERIGLANQTTMLASESLAIAERLRAAIVARYGEDEAPFRFRSFDTICSATQVRQDAVAELLAFPPDLMFVVGGYNSSNTGHLCEMASAVCPTYHIAAPDCIMSAEVIRHKPAFCGREIQSRNWLPPGELTIGLTSGASTPDRSLGEVVLRLVEVAGETPPSDWAARGAFETGG